MALQIEILGSLGQYVRGDFLILSLVLGYVLLFLFFYGDAEPAKTRWSSIEWGERFFLGLLLGMSLLFSFSIGTTLYYYVAQSILLERALDASLIWFACCWIVGLLGFILRLLVGGPIHGDSGQRIMGEAYSVVFKPSLWLTPLVFLFATGVFSSFYPYNYAVLSGLWYALFGYSLLAIVSCLWIPVYILLLLSTPVVPKIVLKKHDFKRLFRRLIAVRTIKRAFNNLARAFRRNQNLAKVIVLVVMLSLFMVLSDVQFGVFSPRVSRVDTTVGPTYTVQGNLTNYDVLVHVTKAYHVDSPMLWLIRNLTISNPSNFSYSEASGPGGMRASLSGPNTKLSTVANSSGDIESFVLYLSPSQASYQVVLTTAYDDRLAASIIHVSYGVKRALPNGTYEQTIEVAMKNSLDKAILINNLYVGQYPNILNVTCSEDGKSTVCSNYSPQQVWLMSRTLSKGELLTIQLSVVFTYGG
jgi:hypothetical protein